MLLINIIVATLLVSLISLIGIITFYIKEKLLERILIYLVSLSAGVLLGGAFLHLLPDSIEIIGSDSTSLTRIFFTTIVGFLLFFILEQFITWHHCHKANHHGVKPVSYMILFGDSVHNFIDGLVIAAALVVNPALGVTTVLAIALHEIPQEIGDFGVLVYGGFGKRKALLANFVSASFSVLGGVVGYFASTSLNIPMEYLIPLTAGNFLYIAAADLIPEIKHHDDLTKTIPNFLIFVLGISIIFVLRRYGN